jgi:hypothetical protein
MLYMRVRSFNQQLQLLLELRVEEVYLSYILLTANIAHWNFNVVHANTVL